MFDTGTFGDGVAQEGCVLQLFVGPEPDGKNLLGSASGDYGQSTTFTFAVIESGDDVQIFASIATEGSPGVSPGRRWHDKIMMHQLLKLL